MAGNGNLILKRGTTVPDNAQDTGTTTLLRGMPAAQLVGLSHVVDSSNTTSGTLVYAYENYPNRLWIGMDAFGTTGQESGSGQGGGSAPGAFGGGGFSSQNTSGAATRPIWFGAEIRANAADYGPNGNDTVPTILQADWANPSDYVLVTQKAIQSYVTSQVSGKGTMSSFTIQANGTGTTQTISNADVLNFVDGNGINFSVSATDTVSALVDFSVITGDVSSNKAGAFAVNSATITNGSSQIGNFYPLFVNGSGNTKTFYVDAASTPLQYTPSSNTLQLDSTLHIANTTTASITSGATTGTSNVFAGTTSGIVNIATGGASTTNIGGTGASVNIGTISGNSTLTVRGNSTTGTATIATNSGVTTANVFNSNATTVNIGGGATTGVNIGNASGTVTIAGNLTVNGTTTTVNSTTLTVDDKNIELGSVATPDDATTADGGGITLKGTSTDKTIIWKNDTISGITGVWRFSENLSIASGKVFSVGDDVVLTKTYWKTYNAGSGGGYVMFKAPNLSTSIGNQEYTLPDGYPSGSSKVLQSDTSGNLSWVSTGTATDVGVTATDTNTTYNLVLTTASSTTNASLFVDDSDNITFNTSSNRLTVPNLTFTDGIASTITSPNDGTSTLKLRGYNSGLTSPVEVMTITNSSSGGTPITYALGLSGSSGTINNTSIGATAPGSGAFTTLTSNAATTFTANTPSSSTSTGTLVVTGGVGISGNLYIGGNVGSGTWQGTTIATGYGGTGLTSFTSGGAVYATSTSALTTGTLPLASGGTNAILTASAGSVVYSTAGAMAFTAVGTSGHVLKSNGSSAPTWVDPATLASGAASSITVRRESTGSTTKYPIPFFASNAQDNPTLNAVGNDFTSGWTSDNATRTGYLYSDYTSQTTGSSVTNMSSGLMYQVDESGTSTTGTLYCDYIGATLDCGSY